MNLIAAHGTTSTEISFCGYTESFRPETVNRFVRQYGGNSYYISEPAQLAGIIHTDFEYYQRPAVSDLLVSVHQLGASPQRDPLRTHRQISMGPGEHHTILLQMNVPSREEYGRVVKQSLMEGSLYLRTEKPVIEMEKEEIDLPETYPLAYVTYQFYNRARDRMEYGAQEISVIYEHDYARYRTSEDLYVTKNKAILGTAVLFKQISGLLLSRDFEQAIVLIRDQVKVLENVNRVVDDPLIAEDIDTLNEYKKLIAEYERSPERSTKIHLELRRRKF
jgi:hypothetical protein